MELTKKKTKTIILISSVIFICILGLFSFFEYKWFNNLSSNEYYKTYNSMILNSNRIANREFERITMFTTWLDRYNTVDNNVTDENLENFISSLYTDFDNGTLDQRVITSIGYLSLENDSSREHLYNGSSWSNNEVSSSLIKQIDTSQKMNTFFDNEKMVITININNNKYFIINFNLIEFTNNYLIPAIEEGNNEIQIEWVSQSNDSTINNQIFADYNNDLNYNFKPITTLINGPEITSKNLLIPIITQQIFRQNYQDLSFVNKHPNIFFEPPEIDYETNQIAQEDIYAYLSIKIVNGNFVNSYIEETLSYIFIGGILLISLIGFICILLIYQIIRIKKQQNKEREFTASITHELRTPLTVIQSASDNLSENLVRTERIPYYGKLIKQQSKRLNSMIENLLVFSKIENNKSYKKDESQVLLKDYISIIQIPILALAKEKEIKIEWSNINLDREVYIDKSLFELVLSNLISNSIFHAYREEKGEIRVILQYSEQNNILNCSIEDDGIGIPNKEQKFIWESYYRGENSKDSQERGSGLGLFIVKRNISILGGKINLTSPYKRINGKIKNGCKFEFYIPCKEVNK